VLGLNFKEEKLMRYAMLAKRVIISILLNLFLIGSFTPSTWAKELYIPDIKARIGQSIDVPVIIDQVDNLAGVKLVITYDPNILIFKKGSKTQHTSSLMHIVNDKTPGTLIVVMAGAKGLKGKKIPILTLAFEIKKDLKAIQSTELKITEMQLMSDQLKDLTYGIRIGKITISDKQTKRDSYQP
jgi:hypothetical protein